MCVFGGGNPPAGGQMGKGGGEGRREEKTHHISYNICVIVVIFQNSKVLMRFEPLVWI